MPWSLVPGDGMGSSQGTEVPSHVGCWVAAGRGPHPSQSTTRVKVSKKACHEAKFARTCARGDRCGQRATQT